MEDDAGTGQEWGEKKKKRTTLIASFAPRGEQLWRQLRALAPFTEIEWNSSFFPGPAWNRNISKNRRDSSTIRVVSGKWNRFGRKIVMRLCASSNVKFEVIRGFLDIKRAACLLIDDFFFFFSICEYVNNCVVKFEGIDRYEEIRV